MPENRRAINEADRRFIIGQSGGRCNKCRQEVFVENEFGERARLGDDAHIIAVSKNGPRGKDQISNQGINSSKNLMLLCKTCHSEVDQQPIKYTEEILLQIREDHYSWIEYSLGKKIKAPKFHYLSYINVPRADMYAAANSIALPRMPFGNASSIRDLGFEAGRLMYSYVDVLNHDDLYANELHFDTKIEEIKVGSYWFSPPATFRSRKIRGQRNLISAWKKLDSSIYRKFNDWRLFCLIDPRWTTTSTAYSTLSGGTLTTMGLVHINDVNFDLRVAIASPLFLGAPENGFFI
jgi:hypothetical protein